MMQVFACDLFLYKIFITFSANKVYQTKI